MSKYIILYDDHENSNNTCKIRLNDNYELELHDGKKWFELSNFQIKPNEDLAFIIDQGLKKIGEDIKLEKLINTNESLKKAHDNYELIKSLVMND